MIFLEQLRRYCETQNIPIINKETERYLNDYILKYKPLKCLEIGSAIGYSTIYIASILQKWKGYIYGFEMVQHSYEKALYNIEDSGLENVCLYNADFLEFNLKNLDTYFDFIFIDAMKRNYLDFYKKTIPYQSNSCFVIFDNALKFKDKLNNLYDYIEYYDIDYKIYSTSNDDGILIL